MISKEELEEMYWGQGMSQVKIGAIAGVTDVTISNWMKKYNIESRFNYDYHVLSKEKIEELYWDKKMKQSEIAEMAGLSQNDVSYLMKRYGIKTRTSAESILGGIVKPSKEELEEMYWDDGMSLSVIAEKVGVNIQTVSNWMKKYGIELRTYSEAQSRERNGNYRGGSSFEPYCYKFNNAFKEAVRERDDYTCQLCGCEQLLGGRKLSIHHIHYDKENCYPDVVALCQSCNASVNGNRDYWENLFEAHLETRGLLNWRTS